MPKKFTNQYDAAARLTLTELMSVMGLDFYSYCYDYNATNQRTNSSMSTV